jgi:hypothetical protein
MYINSWLVDIGIEHIENATSFIAYNFIRRLELDYVQ